jgi:uncharacterized protein
MLNDRESMNEYERRAREREWTSRIVFGGQTGVDKPPAWFVSSYSLFRSQVLDSNYPCFFGTQAERSGEMFYSFVPGCDIAHLPATMSTFLAEAAACSAE